MNDLPRIRVVMALPTESDGVFEAAGVPVLYSGIGKVNAAIALTRELARYRHAERPMPLVFNVGSAGSRSLATGTLIACHEFVQRDMDVSGLGYEIGVTPFEAPPSRLAFAPLFRDLPGGVCGSGDSFATGATPIACSVVDMEAYALAKVCWLEQAPFACVKYVSDGADHAAADDWQRNAHKAAEDFLRLYRALLLERG